jgi:hypothetical protein
MREWDVCLVGIGKEPAGVAVVNQKKPPSPTASLPDTKVTKADLAHVDEALRLLSVLNNQFASAQDLSPSVEKMPTLVARVSRAYNTLFIGRLLPALPQQLGGLGNRRFEELLFKYLEDLTELKFELGDS